MNTITVTVRGRTNTGKTTVAEIIYLALRSAGFDHVERQRDAEPFIKETTELRRKATRNKTTIYLEEVQVSDKGPSKAAVALAELISKKFSMEDLDGHVHELKSQEASNINNSSLEEQVDYLIRAGGEEWARSLLLADRDETVQEEADRETDCEP